MSFYSWDDTSYSGSDHEALKHTFDTYLPIYSIISRIAGLAAEQEMVLTEQVVA